MTEEKKEAAETIEKAAEKVEKVEKAEKTVNEKNATEKNVAEKRERVKKDAPPEKSKAVQNISYVIILLIYAAILVGVTVLMYRCDASDEEQRTQEEGCAVHTYKSATGNICQVCGYEYVPEITEVNGTYVAVKDGVKVRNFYYSDETNVMFRINEGDEVTVTGEFLNSVGSKWYITDEGYYIYSDNLKKADEQ